MLAFHRYGDVDWEAPLPEQTLNEDERTVLAALEKRGASFTHMLRKSTPRGHNIWHLPQTAPPRPRSPPAAPRTRPP